MKRYSAYFFDLYGTLADIHTDESRPALWRAVAGFYTARGAAWTGPELRARYQLLCRAEEETLQTAAGPDAWVELELRRVFGALWRERNVRPDEALIQETARLFRGASTTHLRAYSGAAELLAALRAAGSRVILLSNAQSCFTLPELDALGLRASFDRIWISSDVGFRKPDLRFYRAALDELGADPADCLMIGNDPVCDVAGARSAGMDAVYIHSALSPQPAPERTDAVLSLPRMDLKALKALLLRA